MNPSDAKSFGRRGLTPEKPPTVVPATSNLARLMTLARSPLGKQFAGILAGVAILLFLHAAYVVSMKGFGRALDRHWAENAGYPGIEDAYNRATRKDAALEQVHNHCKTRSDFVQLDRAQAGALEGFDGLYSGEAALARAAFYLSCLMREPARLCQATHRTHLVAALNDYFRLMAKVREERYLVTTNPFAMEKSALINPPGSGMGAMSSPPSAGTDARVRDGARALVADGTISRGDLAGVPGDLDLALRGVEAKRTGCK